MTSKSQQMATKVTWGLTFATTKFPWGTKGTAGNVLGVPFPHSPYYYWFRFLQLNDDYDRALNGEKNQITQEVVKDFGKVRGVEFEDWWDKHAYLFAEPLSQVVMKVATSANELAPFTSGNAVNIVVPLDWRNQDLKDAFGLLVDRLVPKRQTKMKLTESQAKYRLGRKWSIKALNEALVVMKAKQAADMKMLETGKKTAWADIGIKAKHSYAKREKLTVGDTKNVHRRITLTVLTTRAYKRAQGFLVASVTNSFPA